MTASLTLEAGIYGAVALGSFYKLDNLESNASHRPNSVVAFGLIIAWMITGIGSLALALLAMTEGASTEAGWWVIFCAIVLTLLTHAAKIGRLLNGTTAECDHESDAKPPINTVVCASVAGADDDDVLAGEFADRIREREFKAMRPVGSDTDEYRVAGDGATGTGHGDGKSLPDVLPGSPVGDKPK